MIEIERRQITFGIDVAEALEQKAYGKYIKFPPLFLNLAVSIVLSFIHDTQVPEKLSR